MKKILVFLLICTSSFASCDWTKIKANPDKTFTYPEELHLCVGRLVQDNKVKTQQVSNLTKAISLKDLALKESDKKATLWNDTATNLEGRLQKVDRMNESTELLAFGAGVMAAILIGFSTAKLVGK